jgi:hypothetical protein
VYHCWTGRSVESMTLTRYRFVECRAIVHSWEQQEDDRTWKQFGVAMQFRCTRCASIRRDVVSTVSGELLYRSYDKPSDYSTTDPMERNDWRLLLLAQRKRRSRRPKTKLTIVKEA